MAQEAAVDAPVFRVVRGAPTDEELAALVAVVGALGDHVTSRAASSAGGSSWADLAARLRRPLAPGPDGWRLSSLPGTGR